MILPDTVKGADGKYRTPSDLNVSVLKTQSEDVRKQALVPSDVMPKFTCEACGERNFSHPANQWPETVTCDVCSHSMPFIRGGFAMRYRINERPENVKLPPKVIIGLPQEMAKNQADADKNSQNVCKAFGIDIDKTTPISGEEVVEAINAARLAEEESKVKAEAKANE